MRLVIQAEDGDEVTVHADQLSVEQAVVRLEIDNRSYGDFAVSETVTLSVERARHLGRALLAAAETIESASPFVIPSHRKTEFAVLDA
jgi:hypothetical protein